MKTLLGLAIICWCIGGVVSFAQASSQSDDTGKLHPRVVVRLMVEDGNGDNQWYACVIKTEELERAEKALDPVKWSRCEVVINSLLYRFAITRDPNDPSAFVFFAVQVPDEPDHPPSLVQLAGNFVPPVPQQSGRIEWRLSHHDPHYFVMYITPFADEASLQKWLAARGGLKGNGKLTPIVGPIK